MSLWRTKQKEIKIFMNILIQIIGMYFPYVGSSKVGFSIENSGQTFEVRIILSSTTSHFYTTIGKEWEKDT